MIAYFLLWSNFWDTIIWLLFKHLRGKGLLCLHQSYSTHHTSNLCFADEHYDVDDDKDDDNNDDDDDDGDDDDDDDEY